HLRIQLQRLRERGYGVLVHPLVIVEDAEVVVRAGVRRIYPPGERPQYLAVALRGQRRSHLQATRTARRSVWSEATSGRSRKKPRRRSSVPWKKNCVSTAKTMSLSPPNWRYAVVSTAADMSAARLGGDGSSMSPMNSLSAFM